MTKTAAFNEAKALYVNQGFTALETAEKTGVSEKQVRRWASKFKWKEQQEKKRFEQKLVLLGLATSREDVITDFADFINTNYPALAPQLTNPFFEDLQQFKA